VHLYLTTGAPTYDVVDDMRIPAIILSLCLAFAGGACVKNRGLHLEQTEREPAHATELPLTQRLPAMVDNYARNPIPENAANAVEAFGAVLDALKRLQTKVARTWGGTRAEAEVDRLELERLYRQQAVRFAALQARAAAARSALDALAATAAVQRGDSALSPFSHGGRGGQKAPEDLGL